MSHELTDSPSLPVPMTTRAKRKRRAHRHPGLLLFVCVSLLVSMFALKQEENVQIGSYSYWVLIGSAAVLPLFDMASIVRTLLGRALPMLLFVLLAGAWHLLGGDISAVMQLGLLTLVLAWVSTSRARFATRDLVRLYLALFLLGIAVKVFTDLNNYGLVPGTTPDDYGKWRVSFFPNVAITGILSLAVVFVVTKERRTLLRHSLVLALACYFLLFSFVRTAFIAALIHFALRWWFRTFRSGPRVMFWTAVIVAVSATLLIAASSVLAASLQQIPLFSQLLLRGESGMTADEIYVQLYRPWLWLQHTLLFLSSPWLMGLGSFDFFDAKAEELIVGQDGVGSESLPTRLLATYGWPSLLFMGYLFARLRCLAQERDEWACACFPALILLITNWGSAFHPSDAIFVLFMLMTVHGSKAFIGCR